MIVVMTVISIMAVLAEMIALMITMAVMDVTRLNCTEVKTHWLVFCYCCLYITILYLPQLRIDKVKSCLGKVVVKDR